MIPSDVSDQLRIPIGDWTNDIFLWLTDNLGALFKVIEQIVGGAVDTLIVILQAPNPIVLAIIFALIGLLVRGWKFAIGGFIGLLLIISMEQWQYAMQTLALVVVATLVALIFAIPMGIAAASNNHISAMTKPLMDLMQTMPAFVWLVPVVTLFGIGVVPGVVATIIFALPPGVRFTELGIRGVDSEIVEASHAFGATPRQTLFGVQLPLAMPTIMAGINQVIMLALSMAVIAGLVGAEGLGGQVTAAIAILDLGLGFEAGLSVVFLAIYLDRVTASLGQGKGSVLEKLLRSVGRRAPAVETDSATGAEEGSPASSEKSTSVGA